MKPKFLARFAVMFSFCCCIPIFYYFFPLTSEVSSSNLGTTTKTLILDAGHGGEDGGAVSSTGIPESQINLSIVQNMDSILGFYGTVPILLRNEDISLHDPESATLREKKVSDLKNRVARVEEVPHDALISIHQNTYQDNRYHGGQTFYAPTDGSQVLAQHIQTALKKTLQPDNNRECKPIPDTVYLMNHVSCPAVLVECGFLTNKEEELQLLNPSYQRKLAIVLSAAWLTADQNKF